VEVFGPRAEKVVDLSILEEPAVKSGLRDFIRYLYVDSAVDYSLTHTALYYTSPEQRGLHVK